VLGFIHLHPLALSKFLVFDDQALTTRNRQSEYFFVISNIVILIVSFLIAILFAILSIVLRTNRLSPPPPCSLK
jgi:predicted small integral membrane protein